MISAYAGGMHILNMQQLTKFRDILISGLKAKNGGCIFIGLEQNFRAQNFN